MSVVLTATRSGRLWCVPLLLLLGLLVPTLPAEDKKADDKKLPAALDKAFPENVEDLKAIQDQVKAVIKKVMPATVGLQVGNAAGSGVVVDKEGHILTAGHVSGEPDKPVTIIFPDGKRVKGKTLGNNGGMDSGMIVIDEKGEFPFVEMGKSADVKKGQWVLALGHPGGFRPGRTPPVRLGRVQNVFRGRIQTDCALVGGDSGGPLFDLEGRVIAIHSSIDQSLAMNMHVPVDTYRDTWDRLAKGESWGGFRLGANSPYMGIEGVDQKEGIVITNVVKDTPAEKAGFKVDDVLLSFDGQKVKTFDDLGPLLSKKKVGDKVTVEVERNKETVKLEITLGKRGG